MITFDIEEGLVSRFEKKRRRGGMSECWPWRGYLLPRGHGQILVRSRGKWATALAHRVAWAIEHGACPPRDLCVCHRCDNPPCTNPRHLFLGTQAENIADMDRKGRRVTGNRPLGEDNNMSKLTTSDVVEIRRLCAAGAAQRGVAARFGVTQSAVSVVVRRKSWKHVP